MKVLLINNFHYRKGGSETVYFNTGRLLSENGHEVVWFAFDDPQNLPCSQPHTFADRPHRLSGITGYFYNRKVSRALDEFIEAEKPDIAHVHLIWGGMTPSIFKPLQKRGIPLVHTVHDYRMICPAYTFRDGSGRICEQCRGGKYFNCVRNRCSKGSFVKSLMMAAEMYFRNTWFKPVNNIDGFIFVSKFSRDKHFELQPSFRDKPGRVIYNSFPLSDIPVVEDGGYYLYYGRLSHEKGVSTLIYVAALRPSVKFKIVGTGPLENELRSRVTSLGLDNIEFLGYKTGEELYSVVRNASFVVVPSEWYETLGMTIVEPYSFGRPVIAASIGGITEIVRDGDTGFLFESGNRDSLLDAIDRSLALTPEMKAEMSGKAYDFFLKHFTDDIYISEVMSFYKEIIDSYIVRDVR